MNSLASNVLPGLSYTFNGSLSPSPTLFDRQILNITDKFLGIYDFKFFNE